MSIHQQEEAAGAEPRSAATSRRFRGMLGEMRLSVNRAAQLLGWDQKMLDRRARNQTEFRIDELDHIEHVLGIPSAYLLGFAEKPAVTPFVRKGNAADVVFIQPKTKEESFLSESNRRPFHYKAEGPSILPFRTRPGLPDVESGAGVQDTQISETPGTVFEFPTVTNDGMELGVTADIIHMPGTWTA